MARNYKRDRNGKFARVAGSFSAKRRRKSVAKSRYKATVARNNRGYNNRVKGSLKARQSEFRNQKAPRSKNVVKGGGKFAAGVVLNSEHLTTGGYKQLKSGIKGNAGRVSSTQALARGLQRKQNKTAKAAYRKEIGSTPAKRAAKAGIVIAGVAGLGYAAHRGGYANAYAGSDADGAIRAGGITVGKGRRSAGLQVKREAQLYSSISVRAGSKVKTKFVAPNLRGRTADKFVSGKLRKDVHKGVLEAQRARRTFTRL